MSWALVRSAQFGSSASLASVTNTAFGAGAANGNLLVGFVTFDSTGAPTITSITDNGTGTANTWNIAWQVTQTTDGQRNAMIWCVNARTGGTLTTVTVNLSASQSYRSIILREFSGNHATPNDGTNNSATGSHSSGTDVIASGTVTPSQAGDLVVGGTYNSSAGVTAGTGFTTTLIAETTGANIFMEHRVESGTAASQALFSDSAAAEHLAGVILFKVAAGVSSSIRTPSILTQAVKRASYF